MAMIIKIHVPAEGFSVTRDYDIHSERIELQGLIEAYLEVKPERRVVLEYIRANPDQCAEQIMHGMGAKSPNRVAPRISELLNDYQAIYISGYTKTSSGCTARTYRATDGVRAND